MNAFKALATSLCVAMLVATQTSWAQQLESWVGVGYGHDPFGSARYQWTDSGASHAETEGGYETVWNNRPSVFKGGAIADSTYGRLSQALTVNVNNVDTRSHHASANTRWSDVLTAIGSRGQGVLRVTMRFTAAVEGSVTAGTDIWINGTRVAARASTSRMIVYDVPMTFGSPFSLEVAMLKPEFQGNVTLSANGQTAQGSASFELEVTGVDVLDGSGQVVHNAKVGSRSCTRYHPQGGEIPVGRVYVHPGATGTGSGVNWQNAVTNLRDAIEVAKLGGTACPITEIWVAAGVYTPDQGFAALAGDRQAHFPMLTRLQMLGGFAGFETHAHERDPATNVTILSGDLLGNDPMGGRADNSVSVVRAGAGTGMVLDGFVIRGGYSTGGNDGAGLRITGSSPMIRDCVFIDNETGRYGGATFATGTSAPRFERCRFEGNTAGQGGAFAAIDSVTSVTFEECVFNANRAVSTTVTATGGALFTTGSSPTSLVVNRCEFYQNRHGAISATHVQVTDSIFGDVGAGNTTGRVGGGAIRARSGSVRNSVFRGNQSSDVPNQGSFVGGGAIHNDTDGSMLIEGCTFEANHSARHGGAVFTRTATLQDCTFSGNTTPLTDGTGGGVFASGTAVIRGCTFDANEGLQGLAIHSTGARLEGCVVRHHVVPGNRVVVYMNGGVLDACQIIDNTGSIALLLTGGVVTVANSIIARNDTGILPWRNNAGTRVVHCTVVNNSRGLRAIENGVANLRFVNSILHSNTANIHTSIATRPELLIEHSIVQGGFAGPGAGADIISGNPAFVDSAGGDYRLLANSPAIDRANNARYPTNVRTLDLLGQPRFHDDTGTTDRGIPGGVGGAVLADLGAFEFQGTSCSADCDTSTGPGVLDIFDFLCFGSKFAAGDPYACDFDMSTGPGICDIFDFIAFQNTFAAGCP